MTTDLEHRSGLVLLDTNTGEKIDLVGEHLPDVTLERLAEIVDLIGQFNTLVGERKKQVDTEILARLDKKMSWKTRVGDPKSGRQFDLDGDSPAADTVEYAADELEAALAKLVEDDVIDHDAASSVLKREITLTFTAPIGVNLAELADALKKDDPAWVLKGEPLRLTGVKHGSKPLLNGVNNARKVPAVNEHIAPLERKKKPTREVKVTLIAGERQR